MGIELPGWLTEPLSWITMEWPQADETKLFEAGQVWINFATSVMPIGESANSAAQQVWSANEGPQVDAFQQWWNNEDGPTQRLSEDAIASMIIGAALIVFAAITLAMKIAWIVALIVLAIQVAAAIAASFATFGAASLSIPGFIAVCRQVCMRVLRRVIDDVIKKTIKELLDKAKKLLKKVNLRRGSAGNKPNVSNKIPGLRRRDTPHRTKDMEPPYKGEHDPTDPNRWNFPDQVKHMSPEQLERHRVFVRDGKIYNASDGKPFDGSGAKTLHHGGDGKSMFVMDDHGNMYVSNVQKRGEIHHSSFFRGEPVGGAGEMKIDTDGNLISVSGKSGHYKPTDVQQQQVLEELREQGVDLSQVTIEPGF